MRKKILAFTSAFVLAPAVLFAGAAPVAAHGIETGHTSCQGGILLVVDQTDPDIPWPKSGEGRGPLGADIVVLAQLQVAGAIPPGFGPLLAHEEFCGDDFKPRP